MCASFSSSFRFWSQSSDIPIHRVHGYPGTVLFEWSLFLFLILLLSYASGSPNCAAIMLDITNTVGKFAPYLKSGVKEEMRGEVIQSSLSSAEVDPQSGMTISLTKK